MLFEASFGKPQDPCDSIASLPWSDGEKQYNLWIHNVICKHHIEGKCRRSRSQNRVPIVPFFGSMFNKLFLIMVSEFPFRNLQASWFSSFSRRTPCKWEHPPIPDITRALTQLMDSVRDVGAMEVMELRAVAIQPWDAELLSPTRAPLEVRNVFDGLV